jgi:hypothetical protein
MEKNLKAVASMAQEFIAPKSASAFALAQRVPSQNCHTAL